MQDGSNFNPVKPKITNKPLKVWNDFELDQDPLQLRGKSEIWTVDFDLTLYRMPRVHYKLNGRAPWSYTHPHNFRVLW
jgi:hypothetical protein